MNRLAANWMLLMASAKKGRLPSAYQEVEYIGSTGTQYINTGFIPDQDTKVDITFKFNSFNNLKMLFGARISNSSNSFAVGLTSSNKIRDTYNNSGSVEIGTYDTQKHTIIKDKNNTYLDDVLVRTYSYASFTPNLTMFLFGTNASEGNIGTYLIQAIIYGCRIYDNDVLARDLVPCYRKSDNKPGMFDVVNKVFYVNQGTGEFSLPAEVQ